MVGFVWAARKRALPFNLKLAWTHTHPNKTDLPGLFPRYSSRIDVVFCCCSPWLHVCLDRSGHSPLSKNVFIRLSASLILRKLTWAICEGFYALFYCHMISWLNNCINKQVYHVHILYVSIAWIYKIHVACSKYKCTVYVLYNKLKSHLNLKTQLW